MTLAPPPRSDPSGPAWPRRSPLVAVVAAGCTGCRRALTERRPPRRGPPRPGAPPSAATAACPTSQPAPLPAGQKRTVTIDTPKGTIVIKVDGALSPIAAGNFVALAECGCYDGVVFHRVVPGFVIQGGDGQYGRVGPTGSWRPVAGRHRRPRLHDPGRAGDRDVRPRRRSRWPGRPSPNSAARSSSSSSTTARRISSPRTTPTRSSARSRPGWTPSTRSRRQPTPRTRPTRSSMTKVTVGP